MVLLALAGLALFIRKGGEWDDFPKLLAVALPWLAALALGGRWPGEPAPWRAASLVVGVVLTPIVLLQLVETLGGSAGDSGHSAWVFAATCALAAWCALRGLLPYGVLLAGLAAIAAWLSFWDAVLEDPSGNTFRWLLVFVGLALVYLATRVQSLVEWQLRDLLTAGGIALVAAGFIGVVGTVIGGFFGALAPVSEPDLAQRIEWDLFLVVVSLSLVVVGARAAVRGPVYVGAVGLFAFTVSVGAEVAKIADRDEPGRGFAGWPLVLLLAALAALAMGFMGRDDTPAAETPAPDDAPPIAPAPAGPPVGSPGWGPDSPPRH